MSVKSRLAVLYGSPEEINSHLKINDTHIILSGAENVVAQQRWIIEWTNKGVRGMPTRITWKSKDHVHRISAIEPMLSYGLNVYRDPNSGHTNIREMVDSKVYKSLHSDYFEVSSFLPDGVDFDYIKWDPSNDYDITIDSDKIQVVEYSRLLKDSQISYGKLTAVDKIEAGLFYVDTQDDKDINMSGIRCTWDDDNASLIGCQKTMMFFNPSHIDLQNIDSKNRTDVIDIATPVGLHPKILIDLSNEVGKDNCNYFMFAQLPLQLFIDKFQSTPVVLFGEHDLELPDYKLLDKSWGSETLFELKAGQVNEITLHSRYVEPQEGGGHYLTHVEPIVFLACDTDSDDIVTNPFYNKGLGYESFFTSNTMFQHVESTSIEIPIPRSDSFKYSNVEFTTLLCLILSVIYLLCKIFRK